MIGSLRQAHVLKGPLAFRVLDGVLRDEIASCERYAIPSDQASARRRNRGTSSPTPISSPRAMLIWTT